jgi:hypothetical protein
MWAKLNRLANIPYPFSKTPCGVDRYTELTGRLSPPFMIPIPANKPSKISLSVSADDTDTRYRMPQHITKQISNDSFVVYVLSHQTIVKCDQKKVPNVLEHFF